MMKPASNKPPVFPTWSYWYATVVVLLLVLIGLFKTFTQIFS